MSLLKSALCVLLAVMLVGPAAAKDWNVVRIGTEGTYPPFNYLDENNRFRGFEVDVANALCAQMNLTCEFLQEEWEDMIPALLANRFDAIVGSMSITNERKKRVAFSKRYYQTAGAFIARKASNLRDTRPAAMKGRVIGVQTGTIHAAYLEKVYGPAGAAIKLYTSQQEAQLELARGRVDAVLVDKLGGYGWLQTELGKCCTFAGQDVTDPTWVGEGVGIAFRKEDSDLRERFNAALDAILADGTYQRINEKYFPFSVY